MNKPSPKESWVAHRDSKLPLLHFRDISLVAESSSFGETKAPMTRFIQSSLSLFVVLLGTGCSLLYPPPASYTVVSTQLDRLPESTEFNKVFGLNSDVHGNGWVMRKGTKISFSNDGRCELDTVVYANQGLNLPNAIQLEVVQYGPDGNVLFSVPGNEIGHALHLRHPRRDYPYKELFGYKSAYFPRITTVKFAARLLSESTVPFVPSGPSK